MKILDQPFPGTFLIALEGSTDERGRFTRIFNRQEFTQIGADADIDHTADSINPQRLTLRGLHFQKPPHEEQKLVRCIQGSIFDVAVDLRRGSPTEGQIFHTILDQSGTTILLLPRGTAHGFLTLAHDTIVSYHIFSPYHAASASGIAFDDPDLLIPWPEAPLLVGMKDRQWPRFRDLPSSDQPVFEP